MKLLVLLLMHLSLQANAKVLILDLNDADEEVNACKRAAGDSEVVVINRKALGGANVTPYDIDKLLSKYEAEGVTFDSCLISGHEASGEFAGSGTGKNGFSSADLKLLMKRHPATSQSLKTLMLWGCYTATLGNNDLYWLNKDLPNVENTIGFPLQAPDKSRDLNHQALEWACNWTNRKVLNRKVPLDQLCQMYRNFPVLAQVGAALSNCQGIASNLYDDDDNKKACYTRDELVRRCGVFDPDDSLKNAWDCYNKAEEGCDDPPLDGADVEAPAGKSELRKVYDSANLYRHCADQLKDTRDYDLPEPAIAIRMVKFTQIKNNLNRLNRRELKDYDDRLSALGLGQYALGDLSKLTRRDIVNRIKAARHELGQMSGRVNGTDVHAVRNMAGMLDATFNMMVPRAQTTDSGECGGNDPPRRCFRVCSDFHLVENGVQNQAFKSRCIVSYEDAHTF